MNLRLIASITLGLLGLATISLASQPTGTKLDHLDVYPPVIHLDSRRDSRQIVVTGYVHGVPHDLTPEAVLTVGNARVASCRGSRIVPDGSGRTVLTVAAGGRSMQIPVVVARFDQPDPVRFQFEVLPVLTKQGCATGACHGSPHGKGGFSLSLFGYDPRIDRVSLTRDGFSRRVNVLEPAESLIMKKPQLQIPHVGGKRLRKTDAAFSILQNWISEGAHADLPTVECQRIAVFPDTARVLHRPSLNQQLSVIAYYSDGTARDVTSIATYDVSNKGVASVDANGYVRGLARGQAAVSVRYLDKLVSAYITVVEDVPGFHWNNPPEANYVDRLVDEKLKQLQYLPSEVCSDAVFLRRVSLDLTGLLPTVDVTRRFLSDRSSDRRARLIDSLLETDEFARFWALKQADLMRVSPSRLPDGEAERFAQWIVDSVRSNMPYDQFARAILTAAGDTVRTPQASYFLAIPGTEERTEMTAEIFLGSRVECAKCHNHPFEKWTMRDYYSIGAVFARTQAEKGTVTLASTGEVQNPNTHETMQPWGMREALQSGKVSTDRRVAFADWLTQPGNPLFARVEVNRIWAELMGRGIVDPVDDFRSSNPPSNVALLDALAQEFVRSGYNRKRIIRLICNSFTYQRSSQTNPFNQTDDTLFSHARTRMLSAEQLKDAMGYAAHVLAPPSTLDLVSADLAKQRAEREATVEAKYPEWVQAHSGAGHSKGMPDMMTAILALPPEKRTEEQRSALHTYYMKSDTALASLETRYEEAAYRMAYATQRPYPEASAFTLAFGQPQRTTACTCERQNTPTLLQALELLNGGTAYQMVQRGADHYAALNDDALIDELYLSSVCRLPSDRERTISRRFLAKTANRHEAVTDLVWTLLNTQEFLFQH